MPPKHSSAHGRCYHGEHLLNAASFWSLTTSNLLLRLLMKANSPLPSVTGVRLAETCYLNWATLTPFYWTGSGRTTSWSGSCNSQQKARDDQLDGDCCVQAVCRAHAFRNPLASKPQNWQREQRLTGQCTHFTTSQIHSRQLKTIQWCEELSGYFIPFFLQINTQHKLVRVSQWDLQTLFLHNQGEPAVLNHFTVWIWQNRNEWKPPPLSLLC